MDKIYNKAFKIGFLFNILIFAILNVISWAVSVTQYESEFQFAHSGYSWGFPFEMYRTYKGYPYSENGFTPEGVVINTFVIVGFGFIFGFLFRFIASKISFSRIKLK